MISEVVEKILRNLPDTRNSDILLTIEVWREVCPEKIRKGASGSEGVWLDDLFFMPTQDNVKRVRAKLNAEQKYFPTDWKVARARGIKEDEWRQIMGYPTKEATRNPTNNESYMDPQRDFRTTNKLFRI